MITNKPRIKFGGNDEINNNDNNKIIILEKKKGVKIISSRRSINKFYSILIIKSFI